MLHKVKKQQIILDFMIYDYDLDRTIIFRFNFIFRALLGRINISRCDLCSYSHRLSYILSLGRLQSFVSKLEGLLFVFHCSKSQKVKLLFVQPLSNFFSPDQLYFIINSPMKHEAAEQNITNDSETPRNVEVWQETIVLPEYLKDPQRIQSIISSNEDLIHEQAMTIKSLQIVNSKQQETITSLSQKYQALLQLANNAASSSINDKSTNENKEKPQRGHQDTRLNAEVMLDKIVELEQHLCKTKVELALKQDELLNLKFKRNHKQHSVFSKEATSNPINRETIEQLFEAQPIEHLSQGKLNQPENKELIQHWNKILEAYAENKIDKFKEKIHPLIKKFIPKEIRSNVWTQLVENKIGITNSLYIHLLQRRTKNWVCPKVRQQIDRDIKRSFYGKTQYMTKTGLILEVCQFLEIFHIFRPDVSYIQGMTYPVIILIPIVGKIKAFSLFCNLLLANNFFRKVFSLEDDYVSSTCRVFELLLEEYHSSVSHLMKKHSIQAEIFLIEWIFTIFSRGLSYQTILKFWDHLLYFEEVVIFRISLSIFDQLSVQLTNLNYEQTINLIRNFGENINEEQLLTSFSSHKLSRQKLNRTFEKITEASKNK